MHAKVRKIENFVDAKISAKYSVLVVFKRDDLDRMKNVFYKP